MDVFEESAEQAVVKDLDRHVILETLIASSALRKQLGKKAVIGAEVHLHELSDEIHEGTSAIGRVDYIANAVHVDVVARLTKFARLVPVHILMKSIAIRVSVRKTLRVVEVVQYTVIQINAAVHTLAASIQPS